jgi:hypothetical protein
MSSDEPPILGYSKPQQRNARARRLRRDALILLIEAACFAGPGFGLAFWSRGNDVGLFVFACLFIALTCALAALMQYHESRREDRAGSRTE